jgi:dihydroorotate dehydrogenase electron transfer subunit
MTDRLHAAFYADQAQQRTVAIAHQVRLARDTYRLRFRCPEIARRIVPGQFLMVRLANCNDPLIARPLALYDTALDDHGCADAIDVVYLVKGKFTSRLAQSACGQPLDVWGPLGNGFSTSPAEHVVLVAGGIGQTPFLALGQELLGHRRYGSPARQAVRARQVTLCYGARSADLLAGIEDFQRAGMEVRVATDDGSRGYHGLVTQLLEEVLRSARGPTRMVCCGPEPMMAAVARLAADTRTPCEVSLETPMACGVGICFSCVAKVRDASGGWDYARTCVEGPVFDAADIEW